MLVKMARSKKDQTENCNSKNVPSRLNGIKTMTLTNEASVMRMKVNNICKFVILAEKQLKPNQEEFNVESMQNDYPLIEILPYSTIIKKKGTNKITFKTTNLKMVQNLMEEYAEPMKGLLLSELDEPITKEELIKKCKIKKSSISNAYKKLTQLENAELIITIGYSHENRITKMYGKVFDEAVFEITTSKPNMTAILNSSVIKRINRMEEYRFE